MDLDGVEGAGQQVFAHFPQGLGLPRRLSPGTEQAEDRIEVVVGLVEAPQPAQVLRRVVPGVDQDAGRLLRIEAAKGSEQAEAAAQVDGRLVAVGSLPVVAAAEGFVAGDQGGQAGLVIACRVEATAGRDSGALLLLISVESHERPCLACGLASAPAVPWPPAVRSRSSLVDRLNFANDYHLQKID